jgi:hypothetical protein
MITEFLHANNATGGLGISSPAHCALVMHSHSKSRQFSTPLTKFSKPEEIIFNGSGILHGCTTIRGTGVMTDQGGPVARGAHAAADAGRGAPLRAVASPQRDSGPSTASSATGVRAGAAARQRDSPAGAAVAQPDGAGTSRAVAAAAAEGRGTASRAAASPSPAHGQRCRSPTSPRLKSTAGGWRRGQRQRKRRKRLSAFFRRKKRRRD